MRGEGEERRGNVKETEQREGEEDEERKEREDEKIKD